ncbi:MAG: DUF2141 domain-containing protein [Tannerella sp.]|jgi:uncharacterized protein (DUF2141 family)|nr:DUF2141 domain-containing protein [Tannerella sp.]
MKTILFIFMALAASAVCAQHKLTIVVDGIEKTEGVILVAVYDSTCFLEKYVYGGIARVEGEEATVIVEGVEPGEYAVSVMHDENGNNKLDTGTFGIPTEKTGFSNNARGQMGPPSFKDCMFKLESDSVIYITLWKYMPPGTE